MKLTTWQSVEGTHGKVQSPGKGRWDTQNPQISFYEPLVKRGPP